MGQGYPNKANKIKRHIGGNSSYYKYSLYGTQKKNVENKDIDDWCIIAELELATVAPGSFIPQFPARKRKV